MAQARYRGPRRSRRGNLPCNRQIAGTVFTRVPARPSRC